MTTKEMYYTRSSTGTIILCKSGNLNPEEYVKCCQQQGYDVIKASYNIIDLIEEGDYVNGFRTEIIFDKDEKYLGYKIGACYIRLGQLGIRSIVTKEKFASMSYKVGE